MHKTKLIGTLIAAVAAATAATMLIACERPAKITGGGKITAFPMYPSETATFGFNANGCGDTVKGQFQYKDDSLRWDGGIKLHAQITDATLCEDPLFGCSYCFDGELKVQGTYKSTNPLFPGTGLVTVCLRDGGEGEGTADTVFLALDGGQYWDGYHIEGTVSGNVQEHACDEE